MNTVAVANASDTDREILIPAHSSNDTNRTLVFTMMPIWMQNVYNVTVTIDGII